MDLLNVTKKTFIDDSITNFEYHTYQSYITSELKYNDECRICVQHQDLLTVPGMSELHIQGKLLKHDDSGVVTKCDFVNNFVAFLFEEIRLEFGGIMVDRVINPGVTTSMKAFVSYSPNESVALMNAGWVPFNDVKLFDATTGDFDVCVPLSFLLGFAEDYKKVVINMKQDLVLIRAGDDLNAMIEKTGTEKGKIHLNKIMWRMPHVSVSDYQRLKINDLIENNRKIPIVTRRHELFVFNNIPKGHSFTWSLRSSAFLEKPRFVIFTLQTNKKNNLKQDPSNFDHCNLENIKLHLNSQAYPYENLQLDYGKNHYAIAYNMYIRFQQSYYYGKKLTNEPLLNFTKFASVAPLIVIDCSYQNEEIKTSTMDARLEFTTKKEIPDNTTAYCLVLHEQFFSYEALTGRVRVNYY